MPTYQYVCKACGEGLEAVQSFHDPALTECPACSGELRKVFSSVGVVFKGSGFYRNDSRSPATTSSGSSGEKAKPAASTTDAGSSTPKPEAKPASTTKPSSSDSAA